MIAGIGTDIIRIDRIADTVERHGDRFASRILTPLEFRTYHTIANPVPFLAKRFAAKEATSKALGTGIGKVSFQDIEVINNDSGAPLLVLHGYARQMQRQRNISTCHLSLSDESDNAIAFVVLEKQS
ncbi:holo-ACP synthase [Candidatus Sororendozoicomonas aggregata]|uniref:holo-ACP synthase n=1 Tax=Candidatus Sororendozoicomonas aggregata TaxID=3073239 RepID=UPI002ED68FE2